MEPSLSVIETPVKETCDDGVIVMREEDGGLGFTFIKANSLHLWSMRKDRNGKPQWTNFRAIELEKLLPVGKMSPYVSGFVDGSNCIVMKTDDEVFTIELKSLQTRKVCKREQAYCGFLCTAFWTPGTNRLASLCSVNSYYMVLFNYQSILTIWLPSFCKFDC